MRRSRCGLLPAISLCIASCASVSVMPREAGLLAPPDITAFVNRTLSSPPFRNGLWSLSAVYADSGEQVVSFNSAKAVAPGSNMKLVTSAAALELLGPDFRFRTGVYCDGTPDAEGTLEGSVYFRGAGDPTLGGDLFSTTNHLEYLFTAVLDALHRAGIRRIRGSLVVDNSLFGGYTVSDSVSWGALGRYYGARAGAFCFSHNSLTLYVRPGAAPGEATTVTRSIPENNGIAVENRIITGPAGSARDTRIYSSPLSGRMVLEGSVPPGGKPLEVLAAMPDPARSFISCLTAWLKAKGVQVEGPGAVTDIPVSYEGKTNILTIPSVPLAEIVYVQNHHSLNLYADMLARALGFHARGSGTLAAGVAVMDEYLADAGLPMEGVRLEDGSGVGSGVRVTTGFIAALLRHMIPSPAYPAYLDSFGVAGLADRINIFWSFGYKSVIHGNARIKTGTQVGARAHSGYVTAANGRLIIYSFIMNNFNGDLEPVNLAHQRIVILLAGL